MRKLIWIVALCLAVILVVYAVQTSFRFPTSTPNVDFSSGIAWILPDNVQSDNGVNATVTCNADLSQVSDWIKATTFGFSTSDVPAGSTIDGIEVVVEGNGSTGGDQDEKFICAIVKGGTISATEISVTCPAAMSTVTFGGATEKWGTTWLATDVIATDFGVALRYVPSAIVGGSQIGTVDYIKLSIYYTAAAGVKKRIIGVWR